MPLRFVMYTGSDSTTTGVRWREAVAQAGVTERITVAETPGLLAEAVASPSLFGGQRIVAADLDGITDEELQNIASAAPASDAIVIARATELTAGRKKIAETFGEVVTISTPQAKDLPSRIEALAAAAGVRLNPDARRVVLERAGDDLDRVHSVLEQCRIGHLIEPTVRQLLVLLGTSERDVLPWDVSDAIDRGDLAAAIDAALRCDPIPLVAYLSNRYIEAARVREHSEHPDAQTVIDITGQTRWQAEKTARLATRINSQGFTDRVVLLAESDRLLKTDRDPAATISKLITTLMV
jgi:DNA polymerase III delta subunit